MGLIKLWTEKHKPKKVEEISGQKKAIYETLNFFENWKQGKSLLFHGPPGVGKTLLAEIVANEREWALIQINASDSRTGKEIEELLGGTSKQNALFHKGKLIFLDEVDGISGRERGAAASILKVIKNSKFPIILSSNDPWHPKLRSLRTHCDLVKFNNIPYPSIAKRLRDVAKSENIEVSDDTLKNLARWETGDMRSALLDFQLLSVGREKVTDSDLESLGFRERKRMVYDILPTMFFSGSLKATRKVIWEVDKDPDEIMWWLESNLYKAYKDRESIANGYDLISKADHFRSLVRVQQNWRFKAYMIDLLSGVSLFKDESHGFVPFRPPDKILRMGQSRAKRALIKSLSEKLGKQLHVSSKVIKNEYLPVIQFLLRNGQSMPEELELSDEEIDIIKKY